MANPPKPRPLTVAALLAGDKGVALRCKCGHRTALLPAQVAKMAPPATRLLDVKRRFRCSMCGRSGATDDIRMTLFAVPPPLSVPLAERQPVRH